MNRIRLKKSGSGLLAVLILIAGLSLTASVAYSQTAWEFSPSKRALNQVKSCIAKSLSLFIQGRSVPVGELANESRLKLKSFFKRDPQLEIQVSPMRILTHQRQRNSKVAVLYESGSELGELEFHIDSGTLFIDSMKVLPRYQRLGIGSTLLEAIVKKNPEIKRIKAMMAEDNAMAIHVALRRGQSLESAIRETPAYKIRARLGFSQIVPGSIKNIGSADLSRCEFIVERPSQAKLISQP